MGSLLPRELSNLRRKGDRSDEDVKLVLADPGGKQWGECSLRRSRAKRWPEGDRRFLSLPPARKGAATPAQGLYSWNEETVKAISSSIASSMWSIETLIG